MVWWGEETVRLLEMFTEKPSDLTERQKVSHLKFLYYINIEGFQNNPFTIFFSKLLLQNIDPNPEKRLTILQTIHTFNGFLYERNINNSITIDMAAE